MARFPLQGVHVEVIGNAAIEPCRDGLLQRRMPGLMFFQYPQPGPDNLAGRSVSPGRNLFFDKIREMLAERNTCGFRHGPCPARRNRHYQYMIFIGNLSVLTILDPARRPVLYRPVSCKKEKFFPERFLKLSGNSGDMNSRDIILREFRLSPRAIFV